MATLTGIVVDVSGSMNRAIGTGEGAHGGKWVNSVFQVVNDLIKHDVSEEDRVFTAGVGAKYGSGVIDVLNTIKQQNQKEREKQAFEQNTEKAHSSTIKEIFNIVERNGARLIRKWAEVHVVSDAITEYFAQQLLKNLKEDEIFLGKFVYKFLPESCRNWGDPPGVISFIPGANFLWKSAESTYTSAVSSFRQATRQEIKDVADKVTEYLLSRDMCEFGINSIFSAHDARELLHNCYGGNELSANRNKELMEKIEPYIYGGTPLCSCIGRADKLFVDTECYPMQLSQSLFVFSDGEPSDYSHSFDNVLRKYRKNNVHIICCYISDQSNVEPHRLYDSLQPNWESGAKFLFDVASCVDTAMVMSQILIKRGWQIDTEKNETKLFLHVNSPDHLRDACELARNVVCSQDALSEFLVAVDLDVYINQDINGLQASMQEEFTCYANASATVLHLAMRRILGRGCYPHFEDLRQKMIDQHGKSRAKTLHVLQQICPEYRLKCRKIDNVRGAMQAIVQKRLVVATFRLTKRNWDRFKDFYSLGDGKRILTKDDLEVNVPSSDNKLSGHAVVLTSYNSKCLIFMNSWGDVWGDKGFFRVQNASVLNFEFIDVYWDLDDLTQEERRAYNSHGSEVAQKLMKALKGLRTAAFKCPWCHRESNVTEYTGTLIKVRCPMCYKHFDTKDADGNILALNMHLTSLSC